MTARLLNQERAIAQELLPVEVQAADLVYLKVQAPPAEPVAVAARKVAAQLGCHLER